ncbi:hypothetical protein N9W41_00890, partial [bacterium]|nr:hypothetical protein [bacterium]
KDGKIYVTGYELRTNYDVFVYAINSDGSLDTNFDGDGILYIDNITLGADEIGNAITVDGNGKILVTGASSSGADVDVFVVRLNNDGTLDTSFHTDGIASHHNAAGGASQDEGQDIEIDGEGKIVISGKSENASGNVDLAVWRFNEDGTLDTTFDSDGFFVHNNAAGGNNNDEGNNLLIDGLGRILIAGKSDGTSFSEVAVWRLNSDGTLDTSFDFDGILTMSSTENISATDIALDGAGKILLSATIPDGPSSTDGGLWRLNSDGSLDSYFGNNGLVSLDFGDDSPDDFDKIEGVTTDGYGSIIAVGSGAYTSVSNKIAIAKISGGGETAVGELDVGFNSLGYDMRVGAAGGAEDMAFSVAIDSKGRSVAAGYSKNLSGDKDMTVWRYNPDGSLDTTFDGDGIFVHDNAAGGSGSDIGYGVAIDSKGRIVIVGESGGAATFKDMAIWRLNENGTLDANFDGDGVVTHHNAAGGNHFDRAASIVFDGQGRLIVAGVSRGSFGEDMVIWRYNENGSLDTTFDTDGIVTHNELKQKNI